MNKKIYIRLAKTSKNILVDAHNKPSSQYYSSMRRQCAEEYYPTIRFAITLEMPDDMFKQAEESVAILNVLKKDVEINVKL